MSRPDFFILEGRFNMDIPSGYAQFALWHNDIYATGEIETASGIAIGRIEIFNSKRGMIVARIQYLDSDFSRFKNVEFGSHGNKNSISDESSIYRQLWSIY